MARDKRLETTPNAKFADSSNGRNAVISREPILSIASEPRFAHRGQAARACIASNRCITLSRTLTLIYGSPRFAFSADADARLRSLNKARLAVLTDSSGTDTAR